MFSDKCGVMGLWNHPQASHFTYLGLQALQHRGRESAGIATMDGGSVHLHKAMGQVSAMFEPAILKNHLSGHNAIGHTRYSTLGGTTIQNAQPLVTDLPKGKIALAHNGQFTNEKELKKKLQSQGALFQTSSDTELLLHLLAQSREKSFLDDLLQCLAELEGAFSLVLLYKDQLIAIRDPYGFRPLCLGKKGDSLVVASETCALSAVHAEFLREINPGEVVVIGGESIQSFYPFAPQKEHFCVFELIYFSRSDSIFKGRNIETIRRALGRQLALEAPCPQADFIITIPDSGAPSALGYSETTGLELKKGILSNPNMGRTFIEPTPPLRKWMGRMKYTPLEEVIRGKSLVVMDDSIVRGTTCGQLIGLLKECGAREIHLRISSPIIYHPCHYGIDTPDHDQLMGHRFQNQEKIRDHFQVDSLHFLSLEGLHKVMGGLSSTYCKGCFSGEYPLATHSSKVGTYAGQTHQNFKSV